ncbi:ABC transporter permease [Candidatus Sulfidibacterium hydrothermale]|uniref:ABC transporter permease n=1 Tax=Candidatus Sulfidibacterium hydrothermale TaxID=2875962 RepID=UPI001F0A25DD|nr:ABC transporter permease [Candidatus Sulfidibacterium hydrothermale]UBM61259.1 ABC transporter permease [Candidatus Sulfidibacterium hydrothermale]
MLHYIVKRLFYGILVLWGVVTLVFLLFNLLPGDASRMLLGQRADISSVEAIRKDLGLDKPLYIQYLNFLNDLSPLSVHNADNPKSYWYLNRNKYPSAHILLHFKHDVLVLKPPYLRRSYQSKREVSAIIAEAFPKTFLLAAAAIFMALFLGILLGIPAALYKDSAYDRFMMVFSSLGMSVPSFFAAILIAWLFGFVWEKYTGLPMFGSLYSVDNYTGEVYLNLRNLILPAITLGIRPLAIVISLTRSALLDELSKDYIRTAYAKGLRPVRVIFKHAMRNALNPVITAITGWFASLLAGAVFVEYVFDWKGIGLVIVDGLEKYDLPVIMGVVLFIAVILILTNIFVDILYALLDPRVRLS